MDVLAVVTARDRQSTAAVLRPEVEKYLRRRLKDEGVAAAVEAIERSRDAETVRNAQRSPRADVTPLATARRRSGSSHRGTGRGAS
jgi:hypothetical protein